MYFVYARVYYYACVLHTSATSQEMKRSIYEYTCMFACLRVVGGHTSCCITCAAEVLVVLAAPRCVCSCLQRQTFTWRAIMVPQVLYFLWNATFPARRPVGLRSCQSTCRCSSSCRAAESTSLGARS